MRHAAPLRSVPLGAADVTVMRRDDGAVFLRSPHVLGPYPRNLTERLERWVREAPPRVFAAQRDPAGGWRTLTYADAYARVRRIGEALLARGLSRRAARRCAFGERPRASAAHARGAARGRALRAGVARVFAAVEGFRQAALRLRPVDTGPGVRAGRGALRGRGRVGRAEGHRDRSSASASPNWNRSTASARVDEAHARTGPDTIAKFLFTSGSTGQPKAVINTQRMLCANQQMLVQTLPYLAEVPPVLVDWLPWHHTAGGNHNFGIVLYNGGTLYIDEGKPLPGLIETTARQPARNRADHLLQRAAGLRGAAAVPARRRSAAQDRSSAGWASCSTPPPCCRSPCGRPTRSSRWRPAASASSGSPATARPRPRPSP